MSEQTRENSRISSTRTRKAIELCTTLLLIVLLLGEQQASACFIVPREAARAQLAQLLTTYPDLLSNPYGGLPVSPNSPFGNQQPFGQQNSNPFGGRNPNQFGGQMPNQFGGQNPSQFGGQNPNGFGGQQNPGQFGGFNGR